MMNIVVCIKQVPDTAGGVKFKPDGTLDRGAMLAIMNPDDKAGLEAALEIKDKDADDGVLVTDRVLGGADTWATSSTIAGALKNMKYDLIFTGRQAIDGDTAQVGPQIAEHLGIPVISYAREVKVEGNEVVVKRQFDDGYMIVRAKMPCLITALSELDTPRYMTPGGIFDAYAKDVTVWGRKNLDVDDSDIGKAGSPTMIAKASDKVAKGKGVKVTPDTPADAADYIVNVLAEKHVI